MNWWYSTKDKTKIILFVYLNMYSIFVGDAVLLKTQPLIRFLRQQLENVHWFQFFLGLTVYTSIVPRVCDKKSVFGCCRSVRVLIDFVKNVCQGGCLSHSRTSVSNWKVPLKINNMYCIFMNRDRGYNSIYMQRDVFKSSHRYIEWYVIWVHI
jgi:hypothetical protein